ncbi:DUF2683 family protein [Parapedobacter sp. DT-150]|uniref:DUF2683 family protein n=1 Tax=Parapedobacter sp. DT-150 TaxID=3396162 RepID=UPI003F1D859D
MAIITLKVNERTKGGRAFMELVKTLPFITVEDTTPPTQEPRSYNPEFVAKVRRAEKQKGVKVENVEEWLKSL